MKQHADVVSTAAAKGRFLVIAAAFIVAPLTLAACSDSVDEMSDAELREALIDNLSDIDDVSSEQVTCIVDGLFEQTDREQLNRMAAAETADEIPDEDIEVLTSVMFGCL
jgi:hypothetical protein